jgi:SAM-dependent methyltransferase
VTDQNAVAGHYGTEDLKARVNQAMEKAGLGKGTVNWLDLATLDQFHVRGIAATKELALGLGLEADKTVLDVGCGIGGPARHLAAIFGCRVTGIDLNQPFIDVAKMLAERTALADRVTYQQADALDLPFGDGMFDCAWTQHVAMNIADRDQFYGNIHRVLKPDGLLAIYDIVAGEGGPLIFPVPWARKAEISFLLKSDAMREVLKNKGFAEVSWADKTDAGLQWLVDMKIARESISVAPPLGVQVIMGPEFGEMVANLERNLKEGRARVVQAIVRRV